jgi:hypothetical protein
MILFPRFAILGLALVAGISGARAQQAIGLVAGDAFNLYGLNVDVSGCSIGLNGATATACTATNKLELLQVVSPTNTITFDVVGYSGASPGSTTSAALTASSGTSQLNLTLLVTPDASYHTSTTRVTGATLTAVGDDAFDRSTGGTSAQASAAFSAGTTATQLTAALTPQVTMGTPTLQTVPNGPSSLSPNSASFTITENLELNPNNHSVNLLSLNSVALKFTTTPEPASIALLLAGLAGIAVVRRRRTSQRGSDEAVQA